ncbi:CRISPR-associated protein [Chthonomonas calidirosea]|uniref:type III-B CRISPR-associated protein Cas10/Cmr2 n=1 Tax=Chthonomonas calidirosea TaxID=454171 RepID=UPI0006DD4695|nr:type III-B CRISPR-associated protein Cas10/Cmr2 [Chthonomonas calidirosea]CEK16969.1 CRISPR-associated protein [Chthonomonas calidirosea]
MRNLLTISIGPVQEFIAAARKTADLQAGSNLRQRLACEAANYVSRYGELIFPSDAAEGGANKILVLLHENEDPKVVARECHKCLKESLMKCWQTVLEKLSEKAVGKELGNNQVKNFVEFYAAWMPLEDEASYTTARKDLERLLAGRKALRDFKQPLSYPDRFKSPLDPSRDTVIRDHDSLKEPLKLKESEYLDAISLMKRSIGLHPDILDSCFPTRRKHEMVATFQKQDQHSRPQSDASNVASTSEMAFRSLERRVRDAARPSAGLHSPSFRQDAQNRRA